VEGIKSEPVAATGTPATRATSRGPWMISASDRLVGSIPESRISGYVCNYAIPGKS